MNWVLDMNDRSAGLKALPDLMGTPSSSKQVQTIGRWRLQGYHGQSTKSEIIDNCHNTYLAYCP